MKITDSRARDILRWLDDQAGDHTHLFEQMTLYRDAAALIRQLQAADGMKESLLREAAVLVRELDAAEQSAWHAGLDAGREQVRRNRLAEAATHKRELDSAGAFHFSDNGDAIDARIAQQGGRDDG